MNKLLSHTNSAVDSINIFGQIGRAYSNQQTAHSDSLAIQSFEAAIQMAERIHNNRARVFTAIWKGTHYITKDNEKANKLLVDAIDMAKAIHDTSDEALGLLKLGVLYMSIGNAAAEIEMTEAVRLYTSLKDSGGLAGCWIQLAMMQSRQGAYKKAIEYRLLALKMIEKKGSSMSLGFLLMGMGIDHQYLSNFDEALAYYQKAEKVFKEVRSEKFIYSVLLNIGSIYETKKEFVKAHDIYEEALERVKKNNDEWSMIGCLRLIGNLHLEMKEYSKAASYLEQSLELAQKMGDKHEEAEVLNVLASTYYEQKNYKRSLLMADRQVTLAVEGNFKFGLMSAYHQKAKTYAALKDFNDAYDNLVKYELIKDSLFNEEKSKQITEMQTKYETDKKEKEILLLNKDKEVMQTKISRRNLGILGVMAGGALMLSLVILLYNRRNLINQNKYEKEINVQQQQMTLAILSAQEEERQKIAKDMHDSLGAYLSSLKINMEVLQPIITQEKQPIYENVLTALGKVTAEMRGIAKNLVSDTLQQYGLEIAVEELVELINMSGKIKIEFTTNGFTSRLAPQLETSVFRIVQELLNNTLKHAQATIVKLHLFQDSGGISIDFEDNGVGFDREKMESEKKGIGMKNMEARTKILRGTFKVASTLGGGSLFKIEIPNVTG